jgi:hypothetical protein
MTNETTISIDFGDDISYLSEEELIDFYALKVALQELLIINLRKRIEELESNQSNQCFRQTHYQPIESITSYPNTLSG